MNDWNISAAILTELVVRRVRQVLEHSQILMISLKDRTTVMGHFSLLPSLWVENLRLAKTILCAQRSLTSGDKSSLIDAARWQECLITLPWKHQITQHMASNYSHAYRKRQPVYCGTVHALLSFQSGSSTLSALTSNFRLFAPLPRLTLHPTLPPLTSWAGWTAASLGTNTLRVDEIWER